MINKVVGLVIFCLVSISIHGQGIEFEHSTWQEAMEKAKEEGKILFVDCYTTWCGPCKRLAKKVFPLPEVGSYFNENFVNLKVDMESKNGRSFDSKYSISSYPTLLFIDPSGNVVERLVGARPPEALIEAGKQAKSRTSFSKEYKEQYESGDRSYDLVYNYIKALNNGSEPSLKISNDYLNSNPDISEEQRLSFIHEAAVESDSRIYTMMMDNKAAIIKLVGQEEFDKKVKKACKKTVQTAIEYEEPFLLEEAMAAAKTGLDEPDAFIDKLQMIYYTATKDAEKYSTSMKSYWKKYKKDTQEQDMLIAEIRKNFSENVALMDDAVKMANFVYKKKIDLESLKQLVELYEIKGDKDAAIKVLKKALKMKVFEGNALRGIENRLKILEE